MHKLILVAFISTVLLAVPATADACSKYLINICQDKNAKDSKRPTQVIRNQHRERVGDVYDPGTGRLQLRDNHREVQGYIEPDGDVTDSRRQPIGRIQGLPERYWWRQSP